MPDTSPILMFNALWFKPDGGAKKYQEYMRAVFPVVQRHGGRKATGGTPDKALIGTFDADLIFFVEWPSWEAFQAFVEDPEFVAIRPLREEALVDSLLIRCIPT
jgi:uncharacterized protein (DUF1330 family)